MLPQWHSTRYETGIAPSESQYSQPSPSRASALIPFSGLFPARFSRLTRNPESGTLSPSTVPKTPSSVSGDRRRTFLSIRTGSRFPVDSRSPLSARSFARSRLSPPLHEDRPLSALTFSSSADSNPVQAPARVLDYGGNVPVDHEYAATGRRHNSSRRARHGSSRTNSSERYNRARSNRSGSRSGLPSEALRRNSPSRRSRPRWVPKHSKGKAFFPAMQHAAVRTRFFHAVWSGALLLIILIVFLALLGSKAASVSEFRIIAILFMLVFVVLFAHSTIRFFILMRKIQNRNALYRHPSLSDHNSYVRPAQPIQVVLARDEELGIGGTSIIDPKYATKTPPPPPPAYGLWRGSVRVDPNLLHWQRVHESNTDQRRSSVETVHQPPSYPLDRQNPDYDVGRILPEPASTFQDRTQAQQWRPAILSPTGQELLPQTRYSTESSL